MDPAVDNAVCLDLVQEVIARGGEVPLKAAGLSMGRTLLHGDWVLVRQVAPTDIRTGDIVIQRLPNVFVAHRVIRIWADHDGRYVLTKGDGLVPPDRPLCDKDIVARVHGIRRGSTEVRFDTRRGRLVARLLAWYSMTAWRVARGLRSSKPRTRPGPIRRGFHFVLLLPQALLARLGHRS